ncbi:phosphatidylcholine/phosphatidylserine synthase [Kosakonia sp. MUSA4]|uniref:CDP-alcohol phosphatidyltransferase family protein n=1 Tax=Kosakonia sp. MUSA4 TaxID=2067958 RepID=UPI0015990C15|nr:CDP-alcohol phosphatidyltransferase family protein [Kosakonia sp. MUSA4]QJT83048.1 CDP-diacylglycerol--serine O-phosphatidyltransferase [Kosakonia sp. MUSA4]
MKPLFLVRLSLPDYVTLTGAGITLCALYAALSGHAWLSMSLLFLAMLADALDGKVARYFGRERAFGRYLDGFCDMLLYLIAPALLFYLSGYRGGWSLFSMLMIVCGSIRLSRFNESGNITHNRALAYRGMPVFWSLFILGGWKVLNLLVSDVISALLLSLALALFSFAMILDRPFFKFSSLNAIVGLCFGGVALFGLLHLGGVDG